MDPRKTISLLLIAFVAASAVWLVVREVSPKRAASSEGARPTAERQVAVYYFHRTARCPTCLKIEVMAKEEVESTFASEIKRGEVRFASINVEEAGNRHFIYDYQLVSQAVVLVEYRDGIEQRWKNLDAIWELVDHEEDFARYVRDEVRLFRGNV